MRTAELLVELTWSSARDPATESAVTDLAVSVLAEVEPDAGFVWRAESVADWLATETGDLVDPSDSPGRRFPTVRRRPHRQLALDLDR